MGLAIRFAPLSAEMQGLLPEIRDASELHTIRIDQQRQVFASVSLGMRLMIDYVRISKEAVSGKFYFPNYYAPHQNARYL
jgi:hypothetical protein